MEDGKIEKLLLNAINFTETVTKVDYLIKEFDNHKKDDDKNFNNLYTFVRELPAKIRKELEEDMAEKYVTQKKFEVFQTEITNSVNNACSKIEHTSDSFRSWLKWTVVGFIGGWTALAALLVYIK